MALLEQLTPGALVKGLLPHDVVTEVVVTHHNSIGVER